MPTHQILPLPEFADSLTRLFEDTEVDPDHASDGEFYQNWTKHSATGDLLRSVGEDSSVDWDEGIATEITEGVKAGHKDVSSLLKTLKKIATLPPLPFVLEELRTNTHHKAVKFLQRKARSAGHGFLLSNKQVGALPVIDDSLTDPKYAAGVVSAFLDVLQSIRALSEITCLTFIEKNLGPVGALGMLSSLVAATGLPACIYRERSWSKINDFTGYKPSARDRTVVIYDLILSGAGIKNSASRLEKRFKSEVAAAIVLHSFDPSIKEIDLGGNRSVQIHALHTDELRQPSSSEKPVIDQTGHHVRPAVGVGRRVPSSIGEEEMKQHTPTTWRNNLGDYRADEKIALQFTEPMLEKAISAIWNDIEFSGMPVDSPNGSVLFVPKDAIALLRDKGIEFAEQVIIGTPTAAQLARRLQMALT